MLSLALQAALCAAPMNVMVLYFDNNTGRAELDVMQKGLADMLLTDLSPPLQVVERERLEAVISELKLQRTKYFDPKTAQKLGKLAGATHAVAGALTQAQPKLRLDVRLFEIATGKVLATSQVTGPSDDLFELERQLVEKLLAALDARATAEVRSGKTSLKALVDYSTGLDLADRGDLKAAQSKLAEVVREAPDFSRAQQKYAELIKRLREAEKKRGGALSQNETTLQAHIDAWRAKRLADVEPDARGLYFGYLFAQSNLTLFRIARLVGARGEKDEMVWVPESKRAELAALERAFIENGERLVADLRTYRKWGQARTLDTELSDEDETLAKELTGEDLAEWSFSSAASVELDLGEFLLAGQTPYWSEIDRFMLRPTPAQRDAAWAKRGELLLSAAERELPLDCDGDEVVKKSAELQDARAERFVAEGRREQAVAQWQTFLDRYPKAEDFKLLTKKVEHLLLISDEVEAAQRQLSACDSTVDFFTLARRTARADGAAGLTRLAAQAFACAQRAPQWRPLAYTVPAKAALALANCPAFLAVRASAAAAKVPLSEETLPKHRCDER